MDYKLIVTEHAEELLDHILYYIMYQLKNSEAAGKLMDQIEKVYDNFGSNPQIYAYAEDLHLISKGYRKAVIPHYNYVIIYRMEEESRTVYIMGFFHNLELYKNKL